MKRSILIATGTVLITGFLFGSEIVSYVAGGRAITRHVVKDKIPNRWEIARLRSMLSAVDRTLESRKEALARLQVQASELGQEIATRQDDLQQDEKMLRRAAELLSKHQGTYTISGITYTYDEIDRDAVLKSQRYKQDKELLAARRQTRAEVESAIHEAREVISSSEVERQALANQVDNLEIRAEQRATSAGFDGGSRSSGDAFKSVSKAIHELDIKLQRQETLLVMRNSPGVGIDYSSRPAPSGMDAIAEALQ